ncbi:MAG: GGDEF domain-containing protein [Pseudomonadota bacterium]|nr:GGDEF domain-containing protein [Pseudomonadota bacterium]
MRRWYQAFAFIFAITAVAAVPAQSFSVSRLDADPVPARVISGEHDAQFVLADDPGIINETERSARWWRLTALEAVPTTGLPHLVLHSPYLTQVDVWTPGEVLPIRRSLIGFGADERFSTRALITPLGKGLAPGQHLYLRVSSLTPTAMQVSIEPLAEIHRQDRAYVALRTAVLSTLLVLSLLALGFWLGLGERGYAYLMITLLSQVCYLASVGGELRGIPWLADVFGTDPRTSRLFALVTLVSSVGFIAHYLELSQQQPKVMRLLNLYNIAAGLLIVLTILNVARFIPVLGNLLILAATGTVIVAIVVGVMRGQRSALFLLLSWLPLFVLVVLRIGELLGLWINPAWVDNALPASFAVAGLVITVGLADKMHQLRTDRDHASRMASYDTLTGANSRTVIDEHLKNAVADAHRLDRPLSVVFFDIDRFKQINDVHGHRMGDQCLRIIALRTRNRLRTYDLMGRYGGDEMIVILPDTELFEAIGVAENLRSAVNCRPLSIDGKMLEATLSLGVAELLPDETPEEMLERADGALYASKSAGRDQVTGHDRSMITLQKVAS